MRRFFVAVLVPVFVFCACKDDPKPDNTPKPAASPEPIPSDIVYNSFFASPSATANLRVAFDGGLDAGAGTVAEGPTGKSSVTDPGAEPRTKLAYAFAMGKTSVVTTTISASIGSDGPGGGGDQPPLKFTFNATPKTHTPDGKTHFDIKIQKVEIIVAGTVTPEINAQKGAVEKAFVGLEGGFEVSTNGDIDNLSLATEKVPRMAQQILPLFAQALEFLAVPVPSAPVGVGAKWTTTTPDEQLGGTVTTTYTLTSHTGTTAEIKKDVSRIAPKKAFEDPQAPPGSMIEVKGTGSYVINVRFDAVPTKADGSSSMTISLTAPGQPAQNQTVKQSQTLESK
jgi:Family of unknown function (DUF6263)